MASFLYQDDDYQMFQDAMRRRAGGAPRRFDEYYRCYPMAMMPGPDRPSLNHGGKVFLPASALEKLTRLHIAYPMIFELINGAKEKTTHAGVLEFTAEEGKIYLPTWLMNTLLLEAGDLLQIKSTDLPPGSFIKLQAQSTDFLDISDPKAVLENAFRNFSCLTLGDIFSFEYNDTVYEVAVLEVKPDNNVHGIVTMETDLSVDFAPPKGYEEPTAKRPGAATGTQGGKIHTQGTMAQRINYNAIAPSGSAMNAGEKAASSHFSNEGNRLGNKRTKPASTASTGTSTPVSASGTSTPPSRFTRPPKPNSTNGPQPLRLPKGTLFFGFEYLEPKKRDESGKVVENEGKPKPRFTGMGQTLRGKKVEAKEEDEVVEDAEMGGTKEVKEDKGRRLRDG